MPAYLNIVTFLALTTAIPYPQEPSTTEPLFPDKLSDMTRHTTAPPPSFASHFSSSLITKAPAPTRSKKSHWEPIPVFSKQCACSLATARYPCWATDTLQVISKQCYFEENFSYACYVQAAGGCPTPTRVCSKLYQPTPLPGPHPCELASNPPVFSNLPETVKENFTLPTWRVSLPTVTPNREDTRV